jgi:hypothetical protein
VTKTEHAEYLQTDHWRNLRKRFLADHDHCERCEMPRWLAAIAYDQDLHVHHKSYANRGNEWEICDLEALCRRCHDVETFGRSDLREPKSATCSICDKKHWDPRADRCAYCAQLLEEGPFGIRKYENEILAGHEKNEFGQDPTWAEVMQYTLCGSGSDIERHIAIRLSMHSYYLRETNDCGLTVAEGMLHQVWGAFGSDRILDIVGDLERDGSPLNLGPITSVPTEKAQ